MWFSPARLEIKWVKVAPHLIDTILLISGITLIMITQQYPHQQPWLFAKLVALIAYIGLGTVALKHGKTKQLKILFLVFAIIAFSYIVNAALSKNPVFWQVNYSSELHK